ncbi:MAG: P-type conjugative transfer ATPase TrbB [Succinivibrionaceae bacterium]|nr:P-type conjugative transfer ATPase TrbB [Succinivibrionaceae bacterium]
MQNNLFSERARARLHEAYGETIRSALADPSVTEIILNPDQRLFIERLGTGIAPAGTLSRAAAEGIIRTVAALLDTELGAHRPILSAELPFDGSRFEGLIPPVVAAPAFSIRRHTRQDLSLGDLEAQGALPSGTRGVLEQALLARKTMLIAGETGSGKTTLLGALCNALAALRPAERLVTIEDTPELRLTNPNRAALCTSEGTGMDALVRSALRLRPDRLILGEVRGAEALDLVDAFSTGHRGGLATVHAGSVCQALERLRLLISRNPQAPREIEPLVASAISLVVVMSRHPRRGVCAIAEIKGYARGRFEIFNYTVKPQQEGAAQAA